MDNLDKIVINLQEQALNANVRAQHYRVLYGLYGPNYAGDTLLEFQEKSAYYYEAARLLYRHRLLPQTELTPVEPKPAFDMSEFIAQEKRRKAQEDSSEAYRQARVQYHWYLLDLDTIGKHRAGAQRRKAAAAQDAARLHYAIAFT